MAFDYTLDFKNIDFRKHPEFYDQGKGEQGVLLVEPYKSEILPHWKFKTEEIAKKSARIILSLFRTYKREVDFVGMDMARKFLQMGFTRARRYANHTSGRKYDNRSGGKRNVRPQAQDWITSDKAKAAEVFYAAYTIAKSDKVYLKLAEKHKLLRGLLLTKNGISPSAESVAVKRKSIIASILQFAEERGTAKTSCPSEVARKLISENWKPLMPRVNLEVMRLRDQGRIQILQKGKVIQKTWKGPIRFKLKART